MSNTLEHLRCKVCKMIIDAIEYCYHDIQQSICQNCMEDLENESNNIS